MADILPFPKVKKKPLELHDVHVTIQTKWQGESGELAALAFAALLDKLLMGMIDPDTSLMGWGVVKPKRKRKK